MADSNVKHLSIFADKSQKQILLEPAPSLLGYLHFTYAFCSPICELREGTKFRAALEQS